MTKSEFIYAVAAGASVSKVEADRVIAAAANTLTGVMRSGDSVNLPGLGIFTSKLRAAHPGKNPATGETITIPAKRVAVFKPAKQLKDALN
jgi:DNA-binding protein HU-beta